jgi:hypothetical protein
MVARDLLLAELTEASCTLPTSARRIGTSDPRGQSPGVG